jgi:hypothetical protein
VNAFCTACGTPRNPLTGGSVNLAGQPSKVGGAVARGFGWVVLAMGTLIAVGTFAACSSFFGAAAAAPWVLAVPIAIISWVLSYFLLKGGKQLEKSGASAQKATRTQAVFALANTRGGMVTAHDLAHSIGVTPKEADDILTAMAKEDSDNVSIEVDDNGNIYYRFGAAHWASMASNGAAAGWGHSGQGQMAPNASAGSYGGGVRVPPPATRVADDAGRSVRVDPRDEVEDELASEPDAARRHVR